MIRVGCVSYLNSRPLVWGMDQAPDLQMVYAVPARLLEMIERQLVDVALLPIIDYQRRTDLAIVPGTCIGADGHVHTVRLFSQVPIARITTLQADIESHTSVVLSRIILKRVYGIEPSYVADAGADARLLIGDKVVCNAPPRHPYEFDLAAAWKEHTGLPFVFAAWMARKGTELPGFGARLQDALAGGMENLESIVQSDAVPRGWPAEVARDYLRNLLKLKLDLTPGAPQRQAIERFYGEALALGLIGAARPVELLPT